MIPKVYADWSQIFDEIDTWEIGHVDDELCQQMEKGTIDWVNVVSQRITLRLINIVNNRLQKLSVFFNKRLSVSYNAFDLTNALILYRKELLFIKRLESLPMLPEDLKQDLIKDLKKFAQKAQKSLDDSVKNDLSGELKRIVLGYRIDNI